MGNGIKGEEGGSEGSPDPDWLSKDPIGISGGLNQYVAFANNPVMYVDPHGLDVVYVLDEDNKAALGQGHGAVLVGNDSDGWTYLTHGPYKPPNNTSILQFPTLRDARQSSNAEVSRYDKALRFASTPAQDAAAKAIFVQYINREWKAFRSNCGDAAIDALRAAGVEFDETSWRPNKLYQSNKHKPWPSDVIDPWSQPDPWRQP